MYDELTTFYPAFIMRPTECKEFICKNKQKYNML